MDEQSKPNFTGSIWIAQGGGMNLPGWLVAVGMAAAVGFAGYRLGLEASLRAPPASQLGPQTAFNRSDAMVSDDRSSRTVSQRLAVGAVPPLRTDEPAKLTVSADQAGPNAAVMISGLAAGSVVSGGTQLGANAWLLPVAEFDRAVITPPRGFAGAMDLTLELRVADNTVVDRSRLELQWVEGGKSEARHSGSDVSELMRDGAQRMANGDVAGARLVYRRLADEGEAVAALGLAETYDPPILRKSSITRGVAPDVALAQSWYEKAKALGSAVAAERLEALARLDKVTFTTDFGYFGRNAFFFVALDKGYYRDAGLEVKIVRGRGSADAIRQVGAGNAMFGFADAGTLILARANDQIPVKLVAAVYRKPSHAIFCRQDSGLKRPKDLEGNAIADTAGSANQRLFPAFAKAAGIDAQTVRWVVATSDSLPSLLATNKVPCVGQMTVGEPVLQSQLGPAKLVRFAFSDADLSYYANGVIASAATIASKPDLVHRFVEATVHGMKDAFADPAAAGAIMHKIVPQVDATIAKSEIEIVAELARVPGRPLGEIDPARIDATVEMVKGAFELARPVTSEEVYAPGFVPK